MKKMIILILCMAFTWGCTLVDLTSPYSNIDLLSDRTCDKPCVLGITPGVTTQSEAWNIVNHSALLSGCEEQDLSSLGGGQWIDCNSKSFEIAFPDNNIANWVRISTSSFSIEQLIQKYGPPNALLIIISSLPDEPSRTQALLLYNNIQARVYLVEKSGKNYEIDSRTEVDSFIFNDKQNQLKDSATILGAWTGYGVYSP
ncbi:MAG TPA: hypothetical protein VLX61_04360 [Anaerolineales bacterium]|nr:hypothetical protein [Anaerolineales bacterium]